MSIISIRAEYDERNPLSFKAFTAHAHGKEVARFEGASAPEQWRRCTEWQIERASEGHTVMLSSTVDHLVMDGPYQWVEVDGLSMIEDYPNWKPSEEDMG